MTTKAPKLDKKIAINALQLAGIKATAANIKRAAQLAPTIGPKNTYVDATEISVGARKLADVLAKGTKLEATLPLASAITKNRVAGYNIFFTKETSSITFNPAAMAKGMMAKALGAGPQANPTKEGGQEITIGEKNKAYALEKGKWVRSTLARAAHGPNAAKQLQKLEANGYNIHALRDLLVVKDETGKQTVFAVREHPRLDGAAAKPASADDGPIGGYQPGFAPSKPKADTSRGLVALSEHCTEAHVFGFSDGKPMITIKKPVVYLYPESKTKVSVAVQVKGEFIAQYPETTDGRWEVIATPDGMLFDPKTERRFSYIFWEAQNPTQLQIDPNRAFLVQRDEVEGFLERSARQIGLNDRERTDFVSFWIAAMKRNPTNLVQFLIGDECNAYASMTVEPRPSSELRMFMLFQRAEAGLTVGSPKLPQLPRTGFTVVEWGGANLDE